MLYSSIDRFWIEETVTITLDWKGAHNILTEWKSNWSGTTWKIPRITQRIFGICHNFLGTILTIWRIPVVIQWGLAQSSSLWYQERVAFWYYFWLRRRVTIIHIWLSYGGCLHFNFCMMQPLCLRRHTRGIYIGRIILANSARIHLGYYLHL